jgi:diguanylate cyclase
MNSQLLDPELEVSQLLDAAAPEVPPSLRHRRQVLVGIGVAAVVLGLIRVTDDAVLAVLALGAPVATVIGVVRYRPRPMWPWISLVCGFCLFFLDGVARAHYNTLGNLTVHRSIIPDLLALPGYVLVGVGLCGFVVARSRALKRRYGIVYDGVIAALALLACSWVYLIGPVLRHRGTPLSIRVILVSYPAMSAFLLIVTFQIAYLTVHRRSEAERCLLIAMTGLCAGDMLYMLAEIHVIASSSLWINVPYIVSYIAAIGGVLDPSAKNLTLPGRESQSHWSVLRVGLVAIGLATPAILLLQVQEESSATRIGVFVTVVLLSGMAILQIVRALYDVEKSESRLRYQASHDALTGLPNRRFMEQYLGQAMATMPSEQEAVGVLFLDLDRFKLINDTLGHAHGDALLIQVARRLQANVRPSDLVTRIGGDEFLIVLGEAITVEMAREFANRLRRSLRTPFIVSNIEFVVSASIGVAFARPGDIMNGVEHLIRDADTAMYQAKEGGRDAVAVFEDSMSIKVSERVELERDLRHAVRKGELFVVYQPIVAMSDQQVLGMEALVRWLHPTLGIIMPERFIPIASESDLINEIGTWVLDEALHQLAICRKMPHMNHLTVSVNLSVQQLFDGLLVQRAGRMLAAHGLPAAALCLELTESEIMKDSESAIGTLIGLRRLGITLAIDDFGTEYSSLSYLQRMPFDVLKIDRSFVEPLNESDTASESLVAAIVAMASALGIRTVAEGVETIDQASRLQNIGCEVAQGYMYARPTRVDQLLDALNLLSTPHRLAALHREARESGEVEETAPPLASITRIGHIA